MKYISTRGIAPELNFEGALLSGLARDGGLYLPETWPQLSQSQLNNLRGKPYADVAFAVCQPYVAGTIPDADLRIMINAAYAEFGHPAVTPLKQLDTNHWLLELFHGPTLAFKDVAMQLLARMMEWSLAKSQTHATIVGATSGDTGGAAIEAFKNSQAASLFIMHPHGRVSEVQRRQMTTVTGKAIHNIAIEGNFDDCQAIVKSLFNDHIFRDKVGLAGVNSINWARIMPQITYYVYASLALGSADRPVDFTVPTGNFGDVFAGFVAKRMGAHIGNLIIATNVNDILDRTIKTGRYEITGVVPSSSPSMDIQVSSNFERLLYIASNRNPEIVRGQMASLSQSGAFSIAPEVLVKMRAEFASGAVSEAQTAATILKLLAETGELLDPHTAVGVAVAELHMRTQPMITLATAHPAKFPDAVFAASGVRPGLPQRLSHLMNAQEHFTVLPNSVALVQDHILHNI